MEPTKPGFTDWLSNLSVLQILCAVAALTIIRLIVVRLLNKAGKPPNKGLRRSLVEMADSLIYAFAIAFLLIKPLVAQPFYVPTGSMEPTLRGDAQDSDRIWVDKINYRLHPPHRGDVIVFVPPDRAIEGDNIDDGPGPVHFIKRLIAVGGDQVEVTAGKVFVDGKPWSHSDIRRALARAGIFTDGSEVDSDQFLAVDHVKFVSNGVLANGKLVDKATLGPILSTSPSPNVVIQPGYVTLNDKKLIEPYVAEDPDYDLKIVNGEPLKFDYGRNVCEYDGLPIDNIEYDQLDSQPAGRVPKGAYFMMGDNRNDSGDSTEWGPLDADRVVGKADGIFWPINRVNFDL